VKQVETSIEIDATPERVWGILTDFASWDAWNPTIHRLRGRPEVDAKVDFMIRLGKRWLPIRAKVLRVDSERELCWRGPSAAALTPIFAGEHYFAIEPLGADRVRFVHGERFSGLLLPVLWRRLEPMLLRGYSKANEGLKRRAEAPD
jgi:hypothetical protein